MDAVIVYFTATFVLCLFLVIFRLLRLSALKRERQRSLEDARHPTSGVILTSWSGGGGDARVRADFRVWTVGHHHPAATTFNVWNDTPPKYDELFPVKIAVEDGAAAADDKENKDGNFGVQHI